MIDTYKVGELVEVRRIMETEWRDGLVEEVYPPRCMGDWTSYLVKVVGMDSWMSGCMDSGRIRKKFQIRERVQVLVQDAWVDAMVDDYCRSVAVCVFPDKPIGSPGWKIECTIGVDIRKHPDGFSLVPPNIVDHPGIKQKAEALTWTPEVWKLAPPIIVPVRQNFAAHEAYTIGATSVRDNLTHLSLASFPPTKTVLAGPVNFYYGTADWHDGVGWYWADSDSELPRVCRRAFATLREAAEDDDLTEDLAPVWFAPPLSGTIDSTFVFAFVHANDVLDALELDELYRDGKALPLATSGFPDQVGISDPLKFIPLPGPHDGMRARLCLHRWKFNRLNIEAGGKPLFDLTPAQIAAAKALLK